MVAILPNRESDEWAQPMLRDDSTDRGDGRRTSRNVMGEPLAICSIKPMTGFYRDGCCDTGREDVGSHTVCAVMTLASGKRLEFGVARSPVT